MPERERESAVSCIRDTFSTKDRDTEYNVLLRGTPKYERTHVHVLTYTENVK